RVLAQTRSVMRANDDNVADPVGVHLAEVPEARIRVLTRMLQQQPTDGNDDIDVLAMRLLLNDYIAAVAHLRAVARVAASLVDGVTAPVKQGHRLLRLDDKRRQKQAGSAAPPANDQHT
ncbi:MAG TPA: hypothetical protein VIZ32_00255, partial [Vicinamibacterales bacterium]